MLGRWRESEYWLKRMSVDFPQHPFTSYFPAWQPPDQPDWAVEIFEAALAQSGKPWSAQADALGVWYGALLARAGDYARAIEILEPVVNPHELSGWDAGGQPELSGVHALAWAYQQTGAHGSARRLLQVIEERCQIPLALRPFGNGFEWHFCAENSLLLGAGRRRWSGSRQQSMAAGASTTRASMIRIGHSSRTSRVIASS